MHCSFVGAGEAKIVVRGEMQGGDMQRITCRSLRCKYNTVSSGFSHRHIPKVIVQGSRYQAPESGQRYLDFIAILVCNM